MKIYHNARCSKSRQGLEILEKSGEDFEVINYLATPPTVEELKEILKKLGIAPIDLIRKNEQIWKDKFKHKTLSDSVLIEAMHKYPKLIERPIVVKGNKAVLGRPPENITKLL